MFTESANLHCVLQVKPLFEQAEAKNKLLRSVAGGGVDSLNHLLARWDKFELMMESHQLMVKEQVHLSRFQSLLKTLYCNLRLQDLHVL